MIGDGRWWFASRPCPHGDSSPRHRSTPVGIKSTVFPGVHPRPLLSSAARRRDGARRAMVLADRAPFRREIVPDFIHLQSFLYVPPPPTVNVNETAKMAALISELV